MKYLRTLLGLGCVLSMLMLASCSYEDRLAASYAMKRAGSMPTSPTIYCSTTTYGKRSATSCF